MESILVTVTLPGIIGGPVAHTTRQKHTVALSEEFGFTATKVIKHTDRVEKPCSRVFTIPGEHVISWTKRDEAPYWEEPREWKKKSPVQRVISHVLRFDEGYGVSFEFLGDRED